MSLQTASGQELHPIGIGTWLMGGSRTPGKSEELWKGIAHPQGKQKIAH